MSASANAMSPTKEAIKSKKDRLSALRAARVERSQRQALREKKAQGLLDDVDELGPSRRRLLQSSSDTKELLDAAGELQRSPVLARRTSRKNVPAGKDIIIGRKQPKLEVSTTQRRGESGIPEAIFHHAIPPVTTFEQEAQVTDEDLVAAAQAFGIPVGTQATSHDAGTGPGDADSEPLEQTLKLENRKLKMALSTFEQEKLASERKKKQTEAAAVAKKTKVFSPEELEEIEKSDAFRDFFERASLFVERALTRDELEGFNPLKSYEDVARAGTQTRSSETLRPRLAFSSKHTQGRPVMCMDWSPVFPELMLTAYSPRPDALMDGTDGLVHVWSLFLKGRPEYTFTCESPVNIARFHPTNPRLIFGGTYNGQIVVWDTASGKSTPVSRSSFAQGHAHPVYALNVLSASGKSASLVTMSNDAKLCQWADDILVEPSHTLVLKNVPSSAAGGASGKPASAAGKKRQDDIVASSMAISTRNTSDLVVGADDGSVFKVSTHDDAGVTATFEDAHHGPVTRLDFHPVQKDSGRDITDLFLSSSFDWTCKLWSYKLGRPILSFEHSQDYVYDVQWSPRHPALFATVDGGGSVQLWNLNAQTDVPVHVQALSELREELEANEAKAAPQPKEGAFGMSPAVAASLQQARAQAVKAAAAGAGKGEEVALHRLAFSNDGTHLALGASDGTVMIVNVSADVAEPDDEDAPMLFRQLKRLKQRAEEKAQAAAEALRSPVASAPSGLSTPSFNFTPSTVRAPAAVQALRRASQAN